MDQSNRKIPAANVQPMPTGEAGDSGAARPRFHQPISFNGLLTNKILTALPGADFEHLLPYLEPVFLAAGQVIFDVGQTIEYVYLPETAVVSHLHALADGSKLGGAIVGNEGMVGLSAILDSGPALYMTIVTLGGTAIRVKADAVRDEFNRTSAMQRLLLNYTRVRLAQLSQRAVCNARHTLRERLCTWLLMLHDRVGNDQISLTHEKIAHHLGARRAGISTGCNELRDLQIISYQRGNIRIVNPGLLKDTACECYGALQRSA